jgi:hypothetical protein
MLEIRGPRVVFMVSEFSGAADQRRRERKGALVERFGGWGVKVIPLWLPNGAEWWRMRSKGGSGGIPFSFQIVKGVVGVRGVEVDVDVVDRWQQLVGRRQGSVRGDAPASDGEGESQVQVLYGGEGRHVRRVFVWR